MPKIRLRLMVRSAVLLVAFAIGVPACGGSAEIDGRGGGSGATGVGGANGVSGGVGVSGAAGVGGAVGLGGSCGVVQCPALDCASGYAATLEPGMCCPVCLPDGRGLGGTCNVPCPMCAAGRMLVPGADCSCSCVALPETCDAGAAAYRARRNDLLAQPGALSCSLDSDCRLLATDASCGAACAGVAVSVMAAPSIEVQLQVFASDQCAGCPALQPPCAPPPSAVCLDGACVLGGGF